MELCRAECRRVPSMVGVPDQFDRSRPLQAQLEGDVWRVAVASMLLCRTRRIQAEPVFVRLLRRWPTAGDLCRADDRDIEAVVRSCGLHRQRARQLVRFSSRYLGDGWQDLRELPGVGLYVADAVGLFCFGCRDLQSTDYVLRGYVESLCTMCGQEECECHSNTFDAPMHCPTD